MVPWHWLGVHYFLVLLVLEGLSLKQDDIDNHKGVAKEIKDHRAEYDEEPLWTNSMFGGMPATQVSWKPNLEACIYRSWSFR